MAALRSDIALPSAETIEREKIPTVLITHDRDDLSAFSGKVSEIAHGKIISER